MSNEYILKLKNDIDSYIKDNYIPIVYESMCMSRAIVDRSLDDLIEHVNDTFQQAMFYHIDSKGLDEVKVYNDAHIDRRLFSKIRSNEHYRPSKKTAICICMGLKLNLDEANDLLEKAGYTLSHSSKADLIVEYFIKTKEYNLDILNQVLYEYGEDVLYL